MTIFDTFTQGTAGFPMTAPESLILPREFTPPPPPPPPNSVTIRHFGQEPNH